MRVRTNLVRLLAVGCASLATAASAQTIVPTQPKPLPPQVCFATKGCAQAKPLAICFAAIRVGKGPCSTTRPAVQFAAVTAAMGAALTAAQFAPPPTTITKP
jgi:hypothetical protein